MGMMISTDLQTVFELGLGFLYTLNQVSRSKTKNFIGKSVLLLSIMATINSFVFRFYATKSETIKFKGMHLNASNAAISAEKLGEMLFISAALLINNSLFSRIYALLRVPALIYADSVSYMFEQKFIDFTTNLIYGIELIFATLFLILNPLISSKKILNKKIYGHQTACI